jgi:DNA processing protein
LDDLLVRGGRPALEDKQLDFLARARGPRGHIYYAGDLGLLSRPAVSIVGTREVSTEGRQRAAKLARELVKAGVVVVSGLARGVDEAALSAAIDAGGSVIAVIGTPLDKAYPIENAALQETIYQEHLLLSPFATGETVFRSNFPKRNRVMAAISDATVIVEASDTSGTLHQAAECQRLKRWLFIMRAVAQDETLKWPARFVGQPRVGVLSRTEDILAQLP